MARSVVPLTTPNSNEIQNEDSVIIRGDFVVTFNDDTIPVYEVGNDASWTADELAEAWRKHRDRPLRRLFEPRPGENNHARDWRWTGYAATLVGIIGGTAFWLYGQYLLGYLP